MSTVKIFLDAVRRSYFAVGTEVRLGKACETLLGGGTIYDESARIIDKYPFKDNLVTIRKTEKGLGGCAQNVPVNLAGFRFAFIFQTAEYVPAEYLLCTEYPAL